MSTAQENSIEIIKQLDPVIYATAVARYPSFNMTRKLMLTIGKLPHKYDAQKLVLTKILLAGENGRDALKLGLLPANYTPINTTPEALNSELNMVGLVTPDSTGPQNDFGNYWGIVDSVSNEVFERARDYGTIANRSADEIIKVFAGNSTPTEIANKISEIKATAQNNGVSYSDILKSIENKSEVEGVIEMFERNSMTNEVIKEFVANEEPDDTYVMKTDSGEIVGTNTGISNKSSNKTIAMLIGGALLLSQIL